VTDVFTDGAASPNGAGGWAWTDGSNHDSGGQWETTNQRMELFAAIKAIEAHDHPITVYTDSAYVINCFTQKWYEAWRENGWRTSRGKDVANRDLWERLILLVEKKQTKFVKVKGHSGHKLNDLADLLAVTAKKGNV
jgi:ribonuclease HI